MPMPELVRKNAERVVGEFCRSWIPVYTDEALRMTYAVEDEAFTLYIEDISDTEQARIPLAQLRFNDELGQWTLHVPDGKGRWRFYLNARPTLNLSRLLHHLREDPLGFFRH